MNIVKLNGCLLSIALFALIISCNSNSSDSRISNNQDKFIKDSTYLADSLATVAVLSLINEEINLSGNYLRINNVDYYTLGDTKIPFEEISRYSYSYSEAVKAIKKYIDDSEVVPRHTSEYYYMEARKNVNDQIELFDYAFVSLYSTNGEIFEALEDNLKSKHVGLHEDDYIEKIRSKLENGQFILYPLDAYKIVLGKVFYIKFGEKSDESINAWYKILKFKYALIANDETYLSHTQELRRKYE
jgi:hypothetical protein